MFEAPTPISRLELTIAVIGVAEQPSQARAAEEHASGYLQALHDHELVTLEQYREQRAAIRRALLERLAALGGA